MTKEELEIVRLGVKIEALNVLVRALCTGLANSSPVGASLWRGRFEELRQEHSKIALSGKNPVESDLVASEYQEALEGLLTFIEAGFRG